MKRRRFHPDNVGSSLLLVMWALLLLSAAVFGFAKWMDQDLRLHADANRELEARAMAHSGVQFALHPMVTRLTPGLAEELRPTLSYQVRITSEAGKLNIANLIAGEDPAKLDILKRWLERRGLDYHQREVFVDSLLDWVDTDNAHHLNGKEDEGDYHPPNRPLESLEEIADVNGAEPLTRTDAWKDELTIYGGGQIDLTAAGADVLRLIPGLDEMRIQAFVKDRDGPDQINGTFDDRKYDSVATAIGFLGIRPSRDGKGLESLFTVNDKTVHIISEGRSGNVYRQTEVVAVKTGAKPQILSWKE